MSRAALLLLALAATSGCFGARAVRRNFYVLHVDTEPGAMQPDLRGLIRVRDLNAESVYEKFQLVIRQSPWQLRYSGTNLWAVRPNVMIADLIARTMQDSQIFTAVTRELAEARPDFTLAGELQALEIYDSEDIWYAHLAMTLRLNRFDDGEQLWRFDYDERKPVGSTDFAHAVRAMSELLQLALRRAIVDLLDAVEGVGPPPEEGPGVGTFFDPEGPRPRALEPDPDAPAPTPPPPRPSGEDLDEPLIVPEGD
jgi:ABC-type uncharacterized transport system auxiliary subunit